MTAIEMQTVDPDFIAFFHLPENLVQKSLTVSFGY